MAKMFNAINSSYIDTSANLKVLVFDSLIGVDAFWQILLDCKNSNVIYNIYAKFIVNQVIEQAKEKLI